jgi:hypothetical protein
MDDSTAKLAVVNISHDYGAGGGGDGDDESESENDDDDDDDRLGPGEPTSSLVSQACWRTPLVSVRSVLRDSRIRVSRMSLHIRRRT